MAVPQSHLILGGARSGKSRFAVAEARALALPTAFVATAPAGDPGLQPRIARHRAERPPGWITVEEPCDLVSACRESAPRAQLVVVDCLTLWVSNLIRRGDGDEAIVRVGEGLAALLRERRRGLILVSNEVGSGVHPPTALGLRFADLLGAVNQLVAAAADRVTLMVAGIPSTVKQTRSDLVGAGLYGHPPEAP